MICQFPLRCSVNNFLVYIVCMVCYFLNCFFTYFPWETFLIIEHYAFWSGMWRLFVHFLSVAICSPLLSKSMNLSGEVVE